MDPRQNQQRLSDFLNLASPLEPDADVGSERSSSGMVRQIRIRPITWLTAVKANSLLPPNTNN